MWLTAQGGKGGKGRGRRKEGLDGLRTVSVLWHTGHRRPSTVLSVLYRPPYPVLRPACAVGQVRDGCCTYSPYSPYSTVHELSVFILQYMLGMSIRRVLIQAVRYGTVPGLKREKKERPSLSAAMVHACRQTGCGLAYPTYPPLPTNPLPYWYTTVQHSTVLVKNALRSQPVFSP